MSEMSDYQLEQLLFKIKANKNSKTLQNNKLKLEELDPEVKSLDEYIKSLERGEIKVNLNNEKINLLEEFTGVKVVLPDLKEEGKEPEGILYQPNEILEARTKMAYKNEVEEENLDDFGKVKKQHNESKLAKYSVITIKEDDIIFDLVIDQDGRDVGKITYDKNGRPSFGMSEEMKNTTSELLEKSNAKTLIEPDVLQKEFYIQDIDTLVRAIEEDKLLEILDDKKNVDKEKVKEIIKSVGERAISAQRIKDDDYTEEDEEKALTESQDELIEKQEVEEKVRELEVKPNLEKAVPQSEKKNDEKDEDRISNIPEDKKEEIEQYCEKNKIDKSQIKAVLIIMDASTIADSTEKSNINRTGNEVTVLQFSGIGGKEMYRMIQDGVELGGDEHDDSFRNLIAPLHRTTGRIKRVEDNETTLDYTDSTGEINQMQLKRIPQDMSLQEKESFKQKIEKDMEELESAREELELVKDDKELTDKVNKKINSLELKVFNDFVEAGLIPPEIIKEEAEETVELPEEEEKNNGSYTDDDFFDELGRRTRPRN